MLGKRSLTSTFLTVEWERFSRGIARRSCINEFVYSQSTASVFLRRTIYNHCLAKYNLWQQNGTLFYWVSISFAREICKRKKTGRVISCRDNRRSEIKSTIKVVHKDCSGTYASLIYLSHHPIQNCSNGFPEKLINSHDRDDGQSPHHFQQREDLGR
jgi:hypothetical protein